MVQAWRESAGKAAARSWRPIIKEGPSLTRCPIVPSPSGPLPRSHRDDIPACTSPGGAASWASQRHEEPPLMKPVDQGSKKRCQSPALPCLVVPGPSPASPRARAAPRAPALPTSAPFSQHGLSSRGSPCVSPGAKITAGFHPGTETSCKIFPGLHDAAAQALPVTVGSGRRLCCV